MTDSNQHYRKAYGTFSSLTPDYTRCCASVYGGHFRSHQCTRKRGYGPDKAYCKQHDPIARKAKDDARMQKWMSEMNEKQERAKYEANAKTFYNALVQIAEGHNEPSALAIELIAEFHKEG